MPFPLARPSRAAVALATALIALLLVAAAAQAATQTLDDPDDGVPEQFAGKELDVRHVELSQGGGETWVDVTVEAGSRSELDALWVGFDTDFDGDADRLARLRGFADASAVLDVMQTTQATAGCASMGEQVHAVESVPVQSAAGGMQVLELHFPTSAIGGAENYRWAIYAQNDSLTRSSFDYAPDAANPAPGRPNPATQNLDGCDDDGDGVHGAGADRQTTIAVPLKLAGGVVHGTAPSTGGNGGGSGSGGGGANGGGSGGGRQQNATTTPVPPAPPLHYVRTGGTKRMPNLRPRSPLCRQGCTEEQVRQHLAAAGLGAARVVFLRTTEFPKQWGKYRTTTDDGEVFAQDVAPGTVVNVPDMAAIRFLYKKPPTLTFGVWRDKDLEVGCDDEGLEERLRGRAWPGVTTGRGATKERGAQDLLQKGLKCDWRIIEFTKVKGVTAPRIGSAKVRGSKKRVTLKIELPRTSELAIEKSDRPAHAGFNGLDVAGLDRADGAMPVTGTTGHGGFVVKVFYTRIVPSRPVVGALVNLYDGNGELTGSARTDRNGEAAVYGHFTRPGDDGYVTASLAYGDLGLSLDGYDPLKVKRGPDRYRTDIGRRLEWRDGAYRTVRTAGGASARASVVCRGTSATGQTFVIDDLKGAADAARYDFRQAQAARTPEGRRFWLTGIYNRIDGMLRAGAADQQIFTDLVRDIGIGPATVGNGTASTGNCNLSPSEIATLLSTPGGDTAGSANGYSLANGALPVVSGQGLTRLPNGTYIISNDGASIVASDGANIIASDGASIIASDGAGVISTGWLNLIGQAGGNLIGQAGGNLISDKGLG